MPAPNSNAPGLLRQEILEEARRQKEEVLQRARQEAEAIFAKAEKEAEQSRTERMEVARADARRRTEAILATVPVEAGRMRSAHIEELLQEIRGRARERLRTRSGFDFPKAIAGLAAEALRHMAGDTFRLRLPAADYRALGNGLVQEIQQRCSGSALKLRLVADPKLQAGQVLIEDDVGRQVWDLSLEARLERCWPELRRQIAAHTAVMEAPDAPERAPCGHELQRAAGVAQVDPSRPGSPPCPRISSFGEDAGSASQSTKPSGTIPGQRGDPEPSEGAACPGVVGTGCPHAELH